MPTSEPPSSADDDGAALRHDCVFCNSPSASQGPNEREWHTCEKKKWFLLPSLRFIITQRAW